MKKYTLFINYGTDGWSIDHEADDWEEIVAYYLVAPYSDNDKRLTLNYDINTILSNFVKEGE